MEEDFFKVGYSTYLHQKSKKIKWTRGITKKLFKHKFIIIICISIFICLIMNFWLIFKFMKILEMNTIL